MDADGIVRENFEVAMEGVKQALERAHRAADLLPDLPADVVGSRGFRVVRHGMVEAGNAYFDFEEDDEDEPPCCARITDYATDESDGNFIVAWWEGKLYKLPVDFEYD